MVTNYARIQISHLSLNSKVFGIKAEKIPGGWEMNKLYKKHHGSELGPKKFMDIFRPSSYFPLPSSPFPTFF